MQDILALAVILNIAESHILHEKDASIPHLIILDVMMSHMNDRIALGTIAKPFDPMTLTDEIKKLWMHHAHPAR